MRTSSVFRGLLAASAILGLAGGAAAFDVKSLGADAAPLDALKYGLNSYKSGDKETAAEALGYAAENGEPIAQWKLGKMYMEGDGVARDDYKAFQYFSEMADEHAEDGPNQPNARFISNAFKELGDYYKDGIPNTEVKPDPARARQMYAYAAMNFGDVEAQVNLARMYYVGEGGERDPLLAAKWANLAAAKGNVDGQALLGHILFEGDGVPRESVRGLMLLTVARDRAKPADTWVFEMQERALSLATENERRTAMALADDELQKYRKKN